MRIRKYAKISAIVHTNSNLGNDTNECMVNNNLLCQLNQSPWDIITFPDASSSFYQFDDTEVYYNVNLAANVCSIGSIQHFESMASKALGLGETCNINRRDSDKKEIIGSEKGETSENIHDDEEVKLCDKIDEQGWQCGGVVKNGNTMCDYHVSELQSQAVWTTKKKSGPASKLTTAGVRPNRPKKQRTSNPHEFYYYSGFGPSWGKKRGLTSDTTASSSNMNGDMLGQEETGKRFEPDTSIVGPDDDDDDDREIGKVGNVGKKRMRKPIKERSLKSLM